MKLVSPPQRRNGYQAILLAALVSGILGTASAAAPKVFLKLEGTDIASDHLEEDWQGWIAGRAFGKGLHRTSTADTEAPAQEGVRVPQLQRSFDVIRTMDRATPLLTEAALKGTVFPKLTTVWVREGEQGEDRVRIELEHVRIASVRVTGGRLDSVRPTAKIDALTEEVSFVFENAQFLYGAEALPTHDMAANPRSSSDEAASLALFDPSNGPDSDGDGLPDPFEEAHNLNVDGEDADQDLDGDGLTNGEEFAGGSAPDDRNSRFGIDRIQLMQAQPGTGLVSFQGLPGRKYRLLGSPTGKQWFELTAFEIPAGEEAAQQEIELPLNGLTQLLRVEASVLTPSAKASL
jgi:type VI protein secretion system component Hcp